MKAIAKLVSLAKAGDIEATGNRFNQFRESFSLIANDEVGLAVRGKSGASDFAQETLMIAHRKLKQFRGETDEELEGWLRKILCNDWNRVRKEFSGSKKREPEQDLAPDGSVLIGSPPDPQLTPQSGALVDRLNAIDGSEPINGTCNGW